MSKTYTVTNQRTGRSSDSVSEAGVAALLLEVAGGGWTEKQTIDAMQMSSTLRTKGELKVSTLTIKKNQS